MAQTPAVYPSPPGQPRRGGRLRPLAWTHPGHAARPSAWPSRSAVRDRAGSAAASAAPSPHHAKHQHQHDHDDQHPQPCRHGGLLGRRRATQADATAAHPGKQLGHGQATSRARIDGRATRWQVAGTPAPRDLPADLGWPGGVPDRPGRRPRAGPSGAEPFEPRPASPAATVSTSSTTRDEDSAGQPTRRDHSEPDRRDLARPRSVCPAWVGEQSKHGGDETQWPTPRRRRRTDGARLRRNPNVRRGRLHRPALPVQPCSALRDPPRMGPAEANSAAATPLLSCRGPMVSSTRWPLQRGHPWRFRGRGRAFPGGGRPG